jgi:hypothetical protein
MSNTERQRQFRERNPGYYARLHARRRAAENAAVVRVQVVQRVQLALPAPAETLHIPLIIGLSTMAEPCHLTQPAALPFSLNDLTIS